MFEINGFFGMQRDVVLRLCILLWDRVYEIRQIIGMCSQSYIWKKHPYFLENRPVNILADLLGTPEKRGCTITHTPSGLQYNFTNDDDCWHTSFLDIPISQGVYRWVMQIEFGKEISCFAFGAAPPESMIRLFDSYLGDNDDSYSFCAENESGNSVLFSFFGYGCAHYSVMDTATPTPCIVRVSTEADALTHTLSFAVNEKKIPRVICNVPTPSRMAISVMMASKCVWFATGVSFQRIPRATPILTRPQCVYKWGEDLFREDDD